MSEYYGVECETCGAEIALGRRDPIEAGRIAFYVAPLGPIPCKRCGSSHVYGSDDLYEFEAADDVPILGQP